MAKSLLLEETYYTCTCTFYTQMFLSRQCIHKISKCGGGIYLVRFEQYKAKNTLVKCKYKLNSTYSLYCFR